MNKIQNLIKNEVVFCVATILALASSFVVRPSAEYIEYIDFRTLTLLFCLMLAVAGLQKIGVFTAITNKLLKHIRTTRQLAAVLVLLCFFSSMLITNDVSLITFVPFAIMVLHTTRRDDLIIKVVVLQTVAANLGSMFTPIGNPQNLYLYSLSGMTIVEFLSIMLPLTLISFVMIVISILMIKNNPVEYISAKNIDKENKYSSEVGMNTNSQIPIVKLVVHTFVFLLSILTVLHILDYRVLLIIVVLTQLVVDRKLLLKADYILLLTFVSFFIFVGNIKNMPMISEIIGKLIVGRVEWVSLLASQVISNVPAAVLLSGFTTDYKALLIGTNIGGLGTLIASMASLISFKLYSKVEGGNKGRYLVEFTKVNLIYLVILSIYLIVI